MIDTPHAAYAATVARWKRCRDVHDGTDAVKASGEVYLPKPEGATLPAYLAYKVRADVFDAFARTVEGLRGLIFQKAPVVTVPIAWVDDLQDVEFAAGSTTFDTFAFNAVGEVLVLGRHGILLDMAEEASGETARPYWISYDAEDIVNWHTERIGGSLQLTRVLLRETVDEFVEGEHKRVEQFRELKLTQEGARLVYAVQLWRKSTAAAANFTPHGVEVVPHRRQEPLDFIPFLVINSDGLTLDVNRPPLVGLADVVLSDYRTSAELENLMYYVGMPIPWVAGATAGSTVRVGPAVLWDLQVDGKAGMIEMTGAGATTLLSIMSQKKTLMAVLGSRLLEQQPGAAETAMAVGMRHAGSHASLRSIAQLTEQGLTRVLQWHGWWVGTEATPQDVDAGVELNKDFFAVQMSPEDIKAQVFAWQSEAISYQTMYANLAKGSQTRAEVSAEEELKAIEIESPDGPPSAEA